MIRLTVATHYLRLAPTISMSIDDGRGGLNASLALISAPVTAELVDALRAAAKEASEALDAYRTQESAA